MSATVSGQVASDDLASLLVEKYLRSEDGVNAINKKVEEVVNKAISDSLSYHSPFGQQVKEAVKKCLKVHGDIDLPSYGQSILNLIAAQVESATKDSIEKQVAERIKDLLKPAPEKIKLSELVEQYRKYVRERMDSGCLCDSSRQFKFRVTKRDGRFAYVQLSENTGDKTPDIEFGIYYNKEGGVCIGSVFTLSFDGCREVEKSLFAGPLYAFQRSVFQMQAAKTLIELDVSDDDVETFYGQED